MIVCKIAQTAESAIYSACVHWLSSCCCICAFRSHSFEMYILEKCTALLPVGLEEALIASLADAEGANPAAGAPPASKYAVKSLVREKLSGERLQQLGGAGTQCAVCRSAPFLLPCQLLKKQKKRKDYALWRQFNETPSIIPGCPGCLLLTTRYNSSVVMCIPSVHAHLTSLRVSFMHVHGRHPPVLKLQLL